MKSFIIIFISSLIVPLYSLNRGSALLTKYNRISRNKLNLLPVDVNTVTDWHETLTHLNHLNHFNHHDYTSIINNFHSTLLTSAEDITTDAVEAVKETAA